MEPCQQHEQELFNVAFRSVIETANDAIVTIDSRGKVVSWNSGAEAAFGYLTADMLGRPLSRVIPERFREGHRAGMERLREGDGAAVLSRRLEMIGLHRDGHELPIELSIAQWQSGGERFFTGIIRDVTERKRAEQALARDAQIAAAFADLSRALIDPRPIEELASLVLDYARKLTGSAFGYVGFIDPNTGHLVSPTLTADVWEACRVPQKSFVFERFGGLWGWVLTHREPLLTNDPGNDPRSTGVPPGHLPIQRFLAAPAMIGALLVGQIALANSDRDYDEHDLAVVQRLAALYALALQRQRTEHDLQLAHRQLEDRVRQRTTELSTTNERLRTEIAERQRIEDALREQHQLMAGILENMPVVAYRVDPYGTVTEIMGAGLRRPGVESQEATGTAIAGHPRFKDMVTQALAGHRVHFELQGKYHGEPWAYGHYLAYDTFRGGGAIGFALDITELKQAQEQARRHRTELAHVSRLSTMGEMASAIAHEINQPLCAILTLAQGCLRLLRNGGHDDADLADAMEGVAAQARRAGDILTHIREFSRKREPHRSTIDINEVVRAAVSFVAAETRPTGVDVQLDLAESLPCVMGDTIEIEQVIVNLLLNAIEAMEGTPENERRLLLSTRAAAGRPAIEVGVRDSGRGLSVDQLARLFEPFFTTKPHGLGIGLSISQSIVEAFGGRLWAEPNPEGGATFRFTLPVEQPEDTL